MNIFILDYDPVKAARMQCNKHICKMVTESGQMLSTAHRMLDGVIEKRPSKSGKRMVNYYKHPDADLEARLYNAVHFHHPCTVWTMESSANYRWHFTHFIALCNEYKYRYGKEHMTDNKMRRLLAQYPKNIPNKKQTPFALAMGAAPECVNSNDPVQSYRTFYQTKQDRFKMVWTKREIPEWFKMKETLQ